jgi:DNA-binding GntR family transcriptional regulator
LTSWIQYWTLSAVPASSAQRGVAVDLRDSVQTCLVELRRRIRVGLLQPGQQIRQDALAAELRISRTPLRQALNALVAEGLVSHSPNVGYFVVRLSSAELAEVYLVREVLERRLYETLDFAELDLPLVRELAERVEDAMRRGDVHETTRLNRDFHFAIFAASPLAVVRRFVAGAWSMSEGYRAIYVVDPAARERVAGEHRQLVDALSARDRQAAVAIADRHRARSRDAVSAFIGEPS